MILNLLFDLGGVIMDIKRDNCVEALRSLGMPHPEEYLGDFAQKGPFAQLESGEITPAEFREFIRSCIPVTVTDREIDEAFMKFLIGIPVQRLRDLQLMRQKYNIYMLSNTNPIMWEGKIKEEFRKDGLEMEGYFDGIVTSFNAKCMKPARGIFEYTIEHLGIKPEETIFFDDSQANLDAAAALGFKTKLVTKWEDVQQQ